MLLIEKMETAIDTIRDVDIKSSKETMMDKFETLKDSVIDDKFETFKGKVIEFVPFASESDFTKLEKKVTSLNRKMNQLKKQLKELEV